MPLTISNKTKIVLVVLITFSLGSTLLLDASSKSFHTAAITIDGDLSDSDWASADHKVEWYMNADPENSDGNNYMYLTEDTDNLYVGLDLCSDVTNDETGEWVGIWLNTNQTQVNNASWEIPVQWEAALNRGMESLVHDVDNDVTMPLFWGALDSRIYPITELIPENGTFDGTPSDVQTINSVYAILTSEYNGSHYLTRFDYRIDFYNIYTLFEDLRVEQLRYVTLDYRSFHNVSINEYFLSVSDNSGNLNQSFKLEMDNGTSPVISNLAIYPESFTSESEVILSLNGVSTVPFNSSYDYLRFNVYFNATQFVGDHSAYAYTTIQDYDIAWSYGPSENNASDHRQFEVKIPKSELEGYETDTDLGIIVGGYGTLIQFPNTHNWVYANNTLTGIPEGNSSNYNYYSMPLKGIPPTTTTTTTTGSTTTTTTSGTTTTSPPPEGGDITQLVLIAGAGVGGVVIVLLVVVLRKNQS